MKKVLCYQFILFLMFSCDTSSPETMVEGIKNRKLIRETEFRPNYDWFQSDSLFYEDSLLTRTVFYTRGEFNSEKVFVYEDNKIGLYSTNQTNDDGFLHELTFNASGQLISYRNNGEAVSTFVYNNSGKLVKVSVVAALGSISIDIFMDRFGNIIEEHTKYGSETYIDKYFFDNKINPLKGLPIFDNPNAFINENNIVKFQSYVNGVLDREIIYDYQYDSEGYPTSFLREEDTTYYHY